MGVDSNYFKQNKDVRICKNCKWWSAFSGSSTLIVGDCRNKNTNMQSIAEELVTDETFGCINWEEI